MNSKITPYLLKCMPSILIIVIIIFTARGPIYSGELLPLPPERPQQQQKSVDPSVYTEFKQRVQPLSCPDLKQLREKLINTCSSQQNQTSLNYYMNLKRIVDEILMSKKCR